MSAKAPAAPAPAGGASAAPAAAPAAAKAVTRHKVTNLQTKATKIQAAWDKANAAAAKQEDKFNGQSVAVIAQYTKTTLKSTDIDGQSDPYFVFQLDGFPDVALRTAYQPSTLNPAQYFDCKAPVRFPLSATSAAALAKGTLKIHVEVWDCDNIYDDLMGAGTYELPKPADAKKNGTFTFEAAIKDGKGRDAGVLVFYVFYDLEGQIPVDKDNKATALQYALKEGQTPAGLKAKAEFEKEIPKVEAKKEEKKADAKDAKAADVKADPLDPCTARVKSQEVVKKLSGKTAKNKQKDLTSTNDAALAAAAKAAGAAKEAKKDSAALDEATADPNGGVLKLVSIKTHAELVDEKDPKKSAVKPGGGQKLAAKDTDGWSDPYFIVYFENNNALWRTVVVDNSLTPKYEYDEKSTPTWRLTQKEVKDLAAGKLFLHLEGWDEDVTYDDLIGWTNAKLAIKDNVSQNIELHKQLKDGTNNVGQIKVVLRYETGNKVAAAPTPAKK